MLLVRAAQDRYCLVIDAGHGGHDAGAKGEFSLEKNINLSVALAFGRYVEANCSDVKVVYTRKKDVFVPLHERADIANRCKADVFISIHTNALKGVHTARGTETYTMGMRRSDEKLSAARRENAVIMIEKDYQQHYEGYDPNSPESAIMFEFINDKNMQKSVELARYVQQGICKEASRVNKGVKQDVFLVLRETSMPACLIELGFISTPEEEQSLNSKEMIDRMARGIFKAFTRYKNGVETKIPTPMIISTEEDAPAAAVNLPTERQEKSKAQKEKAKEDNARQTKTQREKAEDLKPQDAQIIFKVQIMAADRVYKAGSERLKGLANVETYKEGGFIKHTYGATPDYNEALRFKRQIADKFPDAFVIAFKNGQKMNINEAIREFKNKRKQ